MYGEKTGNCPDGFMFYKHTPSVSLPGHEGHGSYVVQYQITDGIQVGNQTESSVINYE